MSEEYISRKAVRDAIAALSIRHFELTDLYKIYIKALEDVDAEILKIPAADVEPVRHGKWIWDEDGMDWNIGAWRCSECKSMSPMWWNTDKTSPMNKSGHYYCPNCGARMDACCKRKMLRP